jgi:hypothetical protein
MTDSRRQSAADKIDAMPTKAFFVDMLTKDIALEQAVLDLVDNSVDGAKRFPSDDELPFSGYRIRLRISSRAFTLSDNCGGFSTDAARDYAFRFGRPLETPRESGSIGQFGVGMKRALFKFGKKFLVRSTTKNERWSINVDVDEWEKNDDWHFDWATKINLSTDHDTTLGTFIRVNTLRPAVAARFSTELFKSTLRELIKGKHRQFIAQGLAISINGRHIDATNLYLLVRDDLSPGYDEFKLESDDEADVIVRIIAGVGTSSPREAGWYVVCNGRVVLEAERSKTTGWGVVDQKISSAPSYHNQFARFRGIILFDSIDSARVPWNTTKDDIDADSDVWQRAFPRMMEMMRPVIDFLYELDRDVDEFTKDHSALFQYVDRAASVRSETVSHKKAFTAPRRAEVSKGPRQVKIQYHRPINDIEFLQDELGVPSAKQVGEKTFDMALRQQRR